MYFATTQIFKKGKFLPLLFLIICFPKINLKAQKQPNSWILYNQNYIKIPVAKTGIYEIDKSKIAELGLDPNKKLGLYKKGKQVSLQTKLDKVLFYGERNDGKADSILYRPYNAQPHQYFSLFTDTTYYYLTNLPDSISENKIVDLKVSNGNLPYIKNYQFNEIGLLTNEYTHNDATGPVPSNRTSYFVAGAGYTGPMILNEGTSFKVKPNLIDYCADCPTTKNNLNLLINGRSEVDRSILASYQNIDQKVNVSSFDSKSINLNLPNKLNVSDSIVLKLTTGSRASLSLYQLNYERILYLRKNSSFQLDLNNNKINLEFNKIDAETKPQFFDISSIEKVKEITPTSVNNNTYFLDLNNIKTLYASTETIKAEKLSKKVFKKSSDIDSDFIIISHPKLWESSLAFKDYRSSVKGGNNKVGLFNIKELAEEFNYGEISPLAIRNFYENYILTHKPKNLLLIGRGFNIYLSRYDSTDYRNFVPSYGYPASDLLLTADFAQKDKPRIATGRIPALTNDEVYNYLEKIKIKESQPLSIREKNILHLSGGKSDSEREILKYLIDEAQSISNAGNFGSDIRTEYKNTNEYIVKLDISEDLNKGISLITFLGHSGYDFTDMNIGYVTDPSYGYQETTNYPIMFYNGCQFANSFNIYSTQSDNWLMSKKRGASGIIATTTYSYLSTFNLSMPKFYDKVFKDSPTLSIGEALNKMAEDILNVYYNNESIKTGIHQHIVLGDPSVKIFTQSIPDYTLDQNKLEQFLSVNFANPTIQIDLPILNLGKYEANQNLELVVSQYNFAGQKTTKKYSFVAPKVKTDVAINVDKIPNLKNYVFEIVTASTSIETNKANNIYNFDNKGSNLSIDQTNPLIQVFLNDGVPVYNTVVGPSPKVSVYLEDNFPVVYEGKKAKVKLFIQTADFNSIPTEITVPDSNIVYSGDKLFLNYRFKNLTNGAYQVFIAATDAFGNASSKDYTKIQFIVSSEGLVNKHNDLIVGPNPCSNCFNFKLTLNEGIQDLYELKIYNSTGTEIGKKQIEQDKSKTYCFPADASTGLYLFRVFDRKHNIIDSGKIMLIK